MLKKDLTRNISVSLKESQLKRLQVIGGDGMRSFAVQLAVEEWLQRQEKEQEKKAKVIK